MRKRYRRKRRSCTLCHPEKRGIEPRWKAKDLERLARWERERRHWLGRQAGKVPAMGDRGA